MFWSQVDDNSIIDLIIKEDVTLEEVLDHESILQECKIQNEKLIKFVCLSNNFNKLVNYVLITPSDDIDEKVRFKYPSLVCEVLTSDVPDINDLLMNGVGAALPDVAISPATVFIDSVFDNLEKELNMNPLTLSYIVKIMLNLLKYNNNVVMAQIVRRTDSLNLLLKHVENNAITVFFTEFLMCDEESTVTRIEWLRQEEFALRCAQMFAVTEYRNNAVQTLLCEVIGASWKMFANKEIRDEIRIQLNNKIFLDLIFSHLSNPKADSNLITGCLKVVRTIVDFEIDSEGQKMDSVKEMILKHLYSIIVLLSSPPKQMFDPMPTTIGRITPFGPTRLEIVYLIESLLKLKDCEINTSIRSANIVMVLMAAVSQYKWNTLFQLSLLRIFDLLFADLSATCQYKSLLEHLVSDNDIYHWFMATVTEMNESHKPKPGTMGLLWKIGNHLDALWCSQIAEELINKDAYDQENWSKIVSQYLSPRNTKNVITPPKIDSCFKDVDIKMKDFDEDSISATNIEDRISEFCQNKSSNLDDMFGVSTNDDCDDWIENQLKMPTIPIDDFQAVSSSLSLSADPFKNCEMMADEDSSSDDEVSPAIIRQKSDGRAAKYLVAGVLSPDRCSIEAGVLSTRGPVDDMTSNNGDLTSLFDVPDFGISSLDFDHPWKSSKSADATTVTDNWAHFDQ